MSKAALSNAAESLAEGSSLIDELINAAGDAKRRQRIVAKITDLFAAGSRTYSSEQIALFDDVLQQLAADIEVKARARLAHTLAGMDNAPPRLIRTLAFDDEIQVAGPVLVLSQQLTDDDLIENATSKSQGHLLAIAQRLKLSEAVTDVLVERGDERVVHKVVRNKGARFSLAGYGKLTTRARHDRKLTLALGRRSDIPRQYYLKLLETASASVRAKLMADNPQAAEEIKDTIDNVATAMQREAREASQEHALAVRETNRRLRVNTISETSVHASAHAQEFEKTAVALARLGHFPLDLVERALLDEGEDMVLLLAKAAGCSWTTAREMLVMFAANRGMSPDALARAFESYKKLNQKTALSIVKFHHRSAAKKPAADEAVSAAAPRSVAPALADAQH